MPPCTRHGRRGFRPARLLERLAAQRALAAAHDPEWAAIERRRVIPGRPGYLVVLSPDLPLSDLHRQRAIETSLVPDPWWYTTVAALDDTSGRIRHLMRQRMRERWSKAARKCVPRRRGDDVQNLNDSLCALLAEQLDVAVSQLDCWPGDGGGWASVDDWAADLRRVAVGLRRQLGTPESDAALQRWAELSEDPSVDPETLALAYHNLDLLDAANVAAAKSALRWLSENLEQLHG